jgi:AcrR family transcriptional regulator
MATPVKKGSQQRGVRPRSSAGVRAPKAGARKEQSAARRDAIVAAALDEFSARGFAATRLEDIAKRAGVAKGTIYLHFADKEKLFEEIVRTMVLPFVATVEAMPPVDLPIRIVLGNLIDMFVREIYLTRRRDVLRLVLAEVPRFPALADFYYKNVIERAIGALRGVIGRAVARGELADDTLLRFPQLLIAPGMIAIVWNALFERHAPLDVAALMHAQLDLILGKEKLP